MKKTLRAVIGLIVITTVCMAQTGAWKTGFRYDTGLIAVPTTSTVLVSTDIWVQAIHCLTTTATTLTITDNQGSPLTYFPAVPIAVNSIVVVNYGPYGLHFVGGVKWSAGASGVSCQLSGVQ